MRSVGDSPQPAANAIVKQTKILQTHDDKGRVERKWRGLRIRRAPVTAALFIGECF